MPEKDITNLTGIAAVFSSCGVILYGLFSKTGMDKRVQGVEVDIKELKKDVIFEDRFIEYQTAQTTEHSLINDSLTEQRKLLNIILERLPK